jgi:acyl-CoA synthetase (NDP forming)
MSDFLETTDVLRRGLDPRRVAVYGATDHLPGSQYADAVVLSGFGDRAVLVNPNPKTLHGMATVASARDSGFADIDLAVVATPMRGVLDAIKDCGDSGIGLASIVTAGFAEVGASGDQLQEQLLETARASNVRLIGPNCMGLLNLTTGLRASRPYYVAPAGTISIIGQSGTVPSQIMEELALLGSGTDLWITIGNCADIGAAELIAYMSERDSTRTIVAYLESVPDPDRLRKSLLMARAAGKEVVVLKTGRTANGSRATASHTGAIATPRIFFDLLAEEADVISVDTARQAVEAASILNTIGRIEGKIAVVLSSGGEAALASDLCEEHAVPLAVIREETVQRIKALVPEIGTANPIDMTFAATERGHADEIYDVIADEPSVGCIVLLDGGVWAPGSYLPEVEEKRKRLEHRLASKVQIIKELREHAIAPQQADRAAYVAEGIAISGENETLWEVLPKLMSTRRPPGHEIATLTPEIGGPASAAVRETELVALDLLRDAGVPVVHYQVVRGEGDVKAAFSDLKSPFVLKAIRPGVTHKTELGLVRLGITSEKEAANAFAELRSVTQDAPGTEIVAQPQVGGVTAELVVGVINEDRWGPYILLGSGGIAAEDTGDRSWNRLPLTLPQAEEMVQEIAVCRAIARRRAKGRPGLAQLAQLLVSVSDFTSKHADLVELEINPVLIRDNDVVAVDAVLTYRLPARSTT